MGAKCGPRHGRIVGDTWSKTVRKSVHMLHKPPAWAVDLADLEAAEACGLARLRLEEQEQGHAYEVDLATLRRRGFEFNRGHGAQVALPLEHWTVDGVEPLRPVVGVVRPAAPVEPDGPRQLNLFEAA